MSDQFENGPEFSVECASIIATVLTCALAPAVEFAVMPDRLEVDAKSPADRLKTLRQKLLREAKEALPDGVPYGLEEKSDGDHRMGLQLRPR